MHKSHSHHLLVRLITAAIIIGCLLMTTASMAAQGADKVAVEKVKSYIQLELQDADTGLFQHIDPANGRLEITMYDAKKKSYNILTFGGGIQEFEGSPEELLEKSLGSCSRQARRTCRNSGGVDTFEHSDLDNGGESCSFTCNGDSIDGDSPDNF